MRYCFISLILLCSATSYAQYDCDGEFGLTDAPFNNHYELSLIKANHPEDGFGVYRWLNKSDEDIVIERFFRREDAAYPDRNYYLHPNQVIFWRLKIKDPNKGWHFPTDNGPLGYSQYPSDELTIKPGNYADFIGKIPHDKEEYIGDQDHKYKDYLYQPGYRDYAYRIEYVVLNRSATKGYYLFSTPYCFKP